MEFLIWQYEVCPLFPYVKQVSLKNTLIHKMKTFSREKVIKISDSDRRGHAQLSSSLHHSQQQVLGLVCFSYHCHLVDISCLAQLSRADRPIALQPNPLYCASLTLCMISVSLPSISAQAISFVVTLIHVSIFSTFPAFLGLSIHSAVLELLLFLACLLPQLEIPVLSYYFKPGYCDFLLYYYVPTLLLAKLQGTPSIGSGKAPISLLSIVFLFVLVF